MNLFFNQSKVNKTAIVLDFNIDQGLSPVCSALFLSCEGVMDFIKKFSNTMGAIALTGMGYAIANPSETACSDDDCDRDYSYKNVLYPALAIGGVASMLYLCVTCRPFLSPDSANDYRLLNHDGERGESEIEVAPHNIV
ncbi:MAG: hypothetical protein P1U36_01670 [Legionellaceae bacterium]|nr:hypothetical protein [Legionellaceae bacterium]